jgi:Flagellar motor component
MDIAALLSLVFGFFMLIMAFILEGGQLSGLWQYTAAMIVFGGTIGAVGLSFPMSSLKKIPKSIGKVFNNKPANRAEIMETFMALSTIARKDGLLALEHELETREMDPFIVTGLRLVIDGADEEVVRQILETRIINMEHENEKAIAVFEGAGGFSPTMGVIGTVMGLVSVLGELGGDTGELGRKIGVAFIATLYGVAFANLVYLPIASKLKELNSDDVMAKNMMLEGIQLLRGGSNPAFMKEQLKGYLEDEKEGQTEEGER